MSEAELFKQQIKQLLVILNNPDDPRWYEALSLAEEINLEYEKCKVKKLRKLLDKAEEERELAYEFLTRIVQAWNYCAVEKRGFSFPVIEGVIKEAKEKFNL